MVVLLGLGSAASAQPAAAPAPEPSHRRFAAGFSLGVGVDPPEEEVGFAIAFRLGYRPVRKLAILYAFDISIVDVDPEGTLAGHALVGQLELAPRLYLLAGPALGGVSGGDESIYGGGAMASLGYRVQPFTQMGGFIKGDVEVQLRGRTAFKDGERFDAVLFLVGAGL